MKTRKLLTTFTLPLTVLLSLSAGRAQADILPGIKIGLAPVGITMNQTARLNLVNVGVPTGMLIHWEFIDANGVMLAQSVVTLPLNQIVSFDFRRQGGALRAEVRAQVDIVDASIPSESLRRSLEVFNNDTGVTTVFMGGASP
jgi:hypothetical protein